MEKPKGTHSTRIFSSARKALIIETLVLMFFGIIWGNKSEEITVLLSFIVVSKIITLISPLIDEYENKNS